MMLTGNGKEVGKSGHWDFPEIREVCTRIKAKEVVGREVEVNEWGGCISRFKRQGLTPKHQRCYWNEQGRHWSGGNHSYRHSWNIVFRRCGQLKRNGDEVSWV